MSPFLGQHQNRLDAKGRVSVPAAYRAALKQMTGSSEMILRPSIGHPCIEAWPVPTFNDLEKDLQTLDVLSEDYDAMSTAIYGDAYPVEFDKDGRILIPDNLAKHAGLGDTVVFMGRGSIFLIWAPEAAAARAAEARQRTRLLKQGKPITAAMAGAAASGAAAVAE